MNEGQKTFNILQRLANELKSCKLKLTSVKNCIYKYQNLKNVMFDKSRLCIMGFNQLIDLTINTPF